MIKQKCADKSQVLSRFDKNQWNYRWCPVMFSSEIHKALEVLSIVTVSSWKWSIIYRLRHERNQDKYKINEKNTEIGIHE